MNRIARVLVCCVSAALTQALSASDRAEAQAVSPVCKVYSTDEAGKWVGAKVQPGETAMGGCQWAIGGGKGSMMLVIVPARYHERPTGQKGFRELADIPGKAFVAPFMDGWLAGAIVGKDAVRVTLSGPGASEARTIELLKDAIKRHG